MFSLNMKSYFRRAIPITAVVNGRARGGASAAHEPSLEVADLSLMYR